MVVDFKSTFPSMHIHVKGAMEGVWYELPYLVTEDDFLWVTTEWPPVWLTHKTPMNPCIGSQSEKPTEMVTENPIEKYATPNTIGKKIDLEKETKPKKNRSALKYIVEKVEE